MKISLKSLLKVAMFTFIIPISGCGIQQSQPLTPESVYRSTIVEHDPYKNLTWINGPNLQKINPIPGEDLWMTNSSLRALARGKNILVYQLYVSAMADNWAFYHSAYSIGGNKLPFTSIDRSTQAHSSTISLNEDFLITLSREQLNAAKESGLTFKAVGKRNSTIISMPNAHFVGFLQKVDDYKKQ